MDSVSAGRDAAHPATLRPLLWTNSAAQLAAGLVARLSRAGAILIAARLLGPEGFGRVASGLAAYEMLRVLSELGLDTRLIRRVAQQPAEAASDTGHTVALKAALAAALAAAAVLLTAVTLGTRDAALLAGLCLGLFGLAVAGSVQALATGRLEAPRLLPYQAAAGAVFFAAVAATTALLRHPAATAIAIGASDLVAGWVVGLYRRATPARAATAGPEPWRWQEALREAWPVGGVNVLATAYGRLGIAVLALSVGSAAVAQYGVSYRVVEVFLLAASAVAASTFAVTARLDAQDPAAARDLLDHILGRVSLLTLAAAAAVAALARVLPVALGARYAGAVPTTAVLAFALPPMFVNGLLTAHLYGRGRFATVLRIAAGNLVVNAGLVILLIPRYGPPGAALAVVTTEAANTVWQSRAAGLPATSWTWRVAGISLAAGLVTFFLYHHGT
jgi:O-antigen/teichoic acid export membrane protein